jgi:XTP/dITP diphosphohydrolase
VKLYCATGNAGKLREFRLAAGECAVELEWLLGYEAIPSCAENGATFEENAVLKAMHYGPHAPGLLFADDSGLEVDALGGRPGVYSARFAGPGATDSANNELLLAQLEGVENRAARFVCAIALVEGARLRGVFHGTVEGRILRQPRGENGFGYDPLFYYPPMARTFGEVSDDRKLDVSHRGRALRAMLAQLVK